MIDVRLNTKSQLAGFAKGEDLTFFLKEITGIEYERQPLLMPTEPMLKDYRIGNKDWGVYQGRFLSLMAEREIEKRLAPDILDGACLLCSEKTQHYCHRRLVCEYLNDKWGGALAVRHL